MAKDAIEKIKAAESEARKISEDARANASAMVTKAKDEAEKRRAQIISEAKQKASDDIKKAELSAEEYKNNYLQSNLEKNNEPLKLALSNKNQALSGVVDLLF